MERGWLKGQLDYGRSLEAIGREVGLHGSTVAYWAKKHGLSAPGATRFTARGAPDRATLEALAEEGASLREIAVALDRSVATVRHWLRRWGIRRAPGRWMRRVDPLTASLVVERTCSRHGAASFRLEGRGYYRCMRCRQERESAARRKMKRRLVDAAGGCCALCGYAKSPAALQFHHRDPTQKTFALSQQGLARGYAEALAEARKCVLLCANCHAEVEVGYATLPED